MSETMFQRLDRKIQACKDRAAREVFSTKERPEGTLWNGGEMWRFNPKTPRLEAGKLVRLFILSNPE